MKEENRIKVDDIGRGTLIGENGNIYQCDGDVIADLHNNQYVISAYDENDNILEIEFIGRAKP